MPPPVSNEDNTHEGTPSSFATPQLSADGQASPTSPIVIDDDSDSNGVDALVNRAAQRIAKAINDFKRELDQRDTVWGTANGTFELALNTDGSQVYELTIVHDEDGEEYPVTVRAQPKKEKEAANGQRPSLAPLMTAATISTTTTHKPTRRDSDAALEKDVVSRKKRKLEDDDTDEDEEATSNKRARTDDDLDEDIMPLISKTDLEELFSKLRDDVQDDTSECVNHVQRLLRRFKEEWHERTKWEDEQISTQPAREPFRNSIAAENGVAFPSPVAGRDDQSASTADVVRRESKLLSSQIRWVEECRRVAASIHDKREENWRTTSAGFHDRNRHDREAFQNRMLHESGINGKILNQILNEVKAIGLYQQSMKWETPDHLSQHAVYPPQPMVPAFPTRQAPPPPTAGRGRGRGAKQ